jgi:hypothetical protein
MLLSYQTSKKQRLLNCNKIGFFNMMKLEIKKTRKKRIRCSVLAEKSI